MNIFAIVTKNKMLDETKRFIKEFGNDCALIQKREKNKITIYAQKMDCKQREQP